jgi:hypothetical protein
MTALAQEKKEHDYTTLKGLSWGAGFPIEYRDLPGMGTSANIGYDCAYKVNDRFAMGFYLTLGGGYWSEFKKYSEFDHYHITFRLNAGLMMQIGDLTNKPFLLGVCPATGFGFYDMDLVLPMEVRFGRYVNKRWYIMGECAYHISLAGETATIEPAIRVGCNFGRKVKKKESAVEGGLN